MGAVQLHQLPGLAHARKRAQQHRLDSREDSGVEADAERQREHDHAGEERTLHEHSPGEAQVLSKCREGKQRSVSWFSHNEVRA